MWFYPQAFWPPERVYGVPRLLAECFYDVKQCLSSSAHVPGPLRIRNILLDLVLMTLFKTRNNFNGNWKNRKIFKNNENFGILKNIIVTLTRCFSKNIFQKLFRINEFELFWCIICILTLSEHPRSYPMHFLVIYENWWFCLKSNILPFRPD